MKLETALQKIFGMHQFNVKLGLESITKLLDYLGNPQNDFKSIHVAGSNGKGSTCSFIASMLMEAGYKTGLYTSPHFVKFNERVRINGLMVPDEFITDFISGMHNYIDKEKPTFFEITTALGFKYFSEEKIDFGVIETGLGGRLDATNKLNPVGTVITSISKEHTNILGESIKQIAAEKAGIIKQKTPLFIGKMEEEASEVLISKAREMNSDEFLLTRHLKEYNNHVKLEHKHLGINIYKTPLTGYHQKLNAALSVLTLANMFNFNNSDIYFRGIDKVIENSGIQGRYEEFCNKPKIIFDAAHNLEGVRWFLREFSLEKENYNKRKLIFGAMKDKDLENIIDELNPYFDEMIFTSIDYERAENSEKLKEIADSKGIRASITNKAEEIIKNEVDERSDNCLVVLGSIYLLGKIKEKLN